MKPPHFCFLVLHHQQDTQVTIVSDSPFPTLDACMYRSTDWSGGIHRTPSAEMMECIFPTSGQRTRGPSEHFASATADPLCIRPFHPDNLMVMATVSFGQFEPPNPNHKWPFEQTPLLRRRLLSPRYPGPIRSAIPTPPKTQADINIMLLVEAAHIRSIPIETQTEHPVP